MKIQIKPEEWVIGEAVLARYSQGDTVNSYRNTFLGALTTLIAGEQAWAAPAAELGDLSILSYVPPTVGEHVDEAIKFGMDDPRAVAYLACVGAVRASLVTGAGWRRVKGDPARGVQRP